MILSIDPGLNHCGAALWTSEGRLAQAWLARSPLKGGDAAARWRAVAGAVGKGRIERLIIEVPQIYRMSPGDPNDLLSLMGVLGCLVQIFEKVPVTSYLPRQWKGTVKKEVMTKRIHDTLSPAEEKRLDLHPPSLAHNVLDAVGIGLHHFGRLKGTK